MKTPVMVVAPSRRCGTTLLQRAVNSSGQVVIYGENFNFVENYPAILKGVLHHYEIKCQNTAFARDKLLSGDYDFDASMLYPDYEAYVKMMRDNLARMYQFYESSTAGYGYEGWGLKHQIRDADAFLQFMKLFPRLRYIFVYRNIVDVARSEKARYPHQYPEPRCFAALGQRWSGNIEAMRRVAGAEIFHLEYRELAEAPEQTMEKLKAFCGLDHIDPAIFERRVNVSPLLDRLSEEERETGYRRPSRLSAQDHAALLLHAEATCRRLGYPTAR